MAHFAEINKDNVVIRVLVVPNEHENNGQNYLANEINLGGTWLKTSYNTYGGVHTLSGTPLRKNYAGIGFTYDKDRDAFIPPKPYDSWLLDEDTCLWNAPVSMPEDGKFYTWNEEELKWEEIISD
jgi:hypothetical protein